MTGYFSHSVVIDCSYACSDETSSGAPVGPPAAFRRFRYRLCSMPCALPRLYTAEVLNFSKEETILCVPANDSSSSAAQYRTVVGLFAASRNAYTQDCGLAVGDDEGAVAVPRIATAPDKS